MARRPARSVRARRALSTLALLAAPTAAALSVTLGAAPAHALVIARVTQHGYIAVDEEDAPIPYEGAVPISNNNSLFGFISDVTAAIDAVPGAPRPDYVATMQTERGGGSAGALAFYMPIRNDVRGLGMRSPTGPGELYDINNILGTYFPLYGYVWLNNIRLYTQPGLEEFGRYLICTQEFGHRWGSFLRIPPRPAGPMPIGSDGGATLDGGEEPADGGMIIMPMPEGGMTLGDATAVEAGAGEDAGAADGASLDASIDAEMPGPDLAVTALLGRDNSHWSYFLNSGGSPMEGNDWEQLSADTFRTRRATFKFSPLDLYAMGLIPASEVGPFWLIAEPDVMGQRDMDGQTIRPASKPEYGSRTVTIRGRRVTYTINDVIRANGPRMPAYVPPSDSGASDASALEGGAEPAIRPQDMRVAWVLMTTRERLAATPSLPAQFDRAIESCSQGFDEATRNLSRLRAVVAPAPADAGTEAGPGDDAGAPDGAAGDASDDVARITMRAGGGCACAIAPGRANEARGSRSAALLGGLVVASVAALRARARRRERGTERRGA